MSPSNIYHSPHFSFRPLVLTISFLFAGMNSAAAAEDSTPKATYIDTQPIVVTATRTTQPLSQPENRGIYTQSDSPKKSSRNIWSLAVVSVDQRY